MASRTYVVNISPAAQRALRKIKDRTAQRRIMAVIEHLSTEPRPGSAKALQGTEGLLRIRAGDYRVVYTVEDRALLVVVITIGHRRQVYARIR